MGPSLRRCLAALSLGLALVALGASPASADPPRPTNYRSEVTAITPPTEAIVAEVVGGDGFLLLEVAEGHEVVVPDYSGDEPYLRFLPDGRVLENLSSGASQINGSRSPTQATAAASGPPRWTTVATDGRWAWHDHRIHSMASTPLPAARTATGVEWRVPIVVDGEGVVIEGRYRLDDAPSPLPWLLLAVALGALTVFGLTRVLSPVTTAGVACLVGGAVATAAGAAQRAASPPGAPTTALVVVLPAVAVIAGVITVMQRGRVLRAVAALAGAAALGSWALLRMAVLWSAHLPTDLDPALDRAATAAGLGLAVAAATLIIRSGALAPPPVAVDPAPDEGPPSGPGEGDDPGAATPDEAPANH